MLSIGIVKESASGERRVAITPELVPRLLAAGLTVSVEAGAGAAARFPDGAYGDAGARIVSAGELYDTADIIACVHRPPVSRLRRGQLVVGLLHPTPPTPGSWRHGAPTGCCCTGSSSGSPVRRSFSWATRWAA
ncbi:hypothetical protein LCN96_25505 [Nonomuraea gerenzanensis]|uniref:proton-translocating NAD(P)(+) transhydrogenase n=1 Tax=Nonomuraea gerenzanensis TaxID=93944 RepID=A0A1M4EAZ8_9ACTN|nr:hypothetical protein LCN96_25505 [Nonomuraea gerenzanensis]SBO96075.1 NAD(P) transhydrogenase alpha subunit [Nonomuraea gerenzanensis]